MTIQSHTPDINSAISAFFTPGEKCEDAVKVDAGYGLILQQFDPENDNFLFLDIDGVLHPFGTMEAFFEDGKFIIRHDTRSWAGISHEPFEKLEYLLHLTNHWNLKIVLHSAWRLAYSLTELRKHLPEKLLAKLVGVTNPSDVFRYSSIYKFIEGAKIKKFMIVDDDLKDFPDSVVKGLNFVGTDRRVGLDNDIIIKLSQGFSRQNTQSTIE